MIDTHAHIYSSKFKTDGEAMLDNAKAAGIEKILMPNVDHESIEPMLELEARHPGFCYAMMGLHPCSVDAHFERQLYEVEDWLSKRPFLAVGEMGLDLYWDKTFLPQQQEAFRVQAAWAKQYGLPLVIHTREAMPETLELLEQLADERLFGVLHCFTGNVSDANRLVEMNFKLGIGGVATFKNGGLEPVLEQIGMEHFVLETDSPYLAPIPFRGKRNEPAYLTYVVERMAQVMGRPVEEVMQATTQNAKALFKLD